MKNRWLPSVVMLGFGIALIITASALFRPAGALWFGLILPVGILVLAAGVYELRNALKNKETPRTPEEEQKVPPEYRRKRAVQTGPERALYRLLCDILSPAHFDVYPETALVSVIDKLTQTGYRNELFRVADFCIVDQSTTEPLLLIELNDASHRRADRAERDRKVAEICAAAGMPLVTLSLAEAADEGFLRKVLKKYL
jgi:hypothetical protein